MTTPQNAQKTGLKTESRNWCDLGSGSRWGSFAINYSVAVIAIVITLAISILLSRYSITVNMMIPVVVAIIVPTWFGGKGPGLMVGLTFELVTIVTRPPRPDESLGIYIFGHISVFALYLFLAFTISALRNAVKTATEHNATLERRVDDRTAQLHAANEELEAFSYSVSHDLRAPVRHINGFSQALLEDYDDKLDETGKTYLCELRGASREIGLLIDDMLLLARVNRREMIPHATDVTAMAHSVVSALKRDHPDRTVEIEIEEGLSAWCDKRLLQILLTNLIGNAWKFTSKTANAEIFVGSEKGTEDPTYFVRDNGAGFDMAYVDKLFGAFQRLHHAREFEGTGVGLATVRRIITRHGGRVWAEGAVNSGATFFFTLPAGKETQDEYEGNTAG